MEPTRRDVLKSATLAPIVFGLAALGCRHGPPGSDDGVYPPRGHLGEPWSPKDGPPQWWTAAYDQVKGGDRVGVALRIPKDRAVARALGRTLVDLCARGTLDQRLLFVAAAVVCLSDAQIAAFVKGARPEDDAILFSGLAERIDGIAIPAGEGSDGARVGEALRALVEGAQGERLAALAQQRKAAATKDELAAYEQLEVTTEGSLTWAFPGKLLPVLIAERRAATTDPARRAKIDRALEEGVNQGRYRTPVHAEQPYGVEMSSEGGGCGGGDRNVDCGMAMPTPSSYRFLGYLTAPG